MSETLVRLRYFVAVCLISSYLLLCNYYTPVYYIYIIIIIYIIMYSYYYLIFINMCCKNNDNNNNCISIASSKDSLKKHLQSHLSNGDPQLSQSIITAAVYVLLVQHVGGFWSL